MLDYSFFRAPCQSGLARRANEAGDQVEFGLAAKLDYLPTANCIVTTALIVFSMVSVL